MADKILVVDDDLETLRLIGMMLQRQGYEIIAASSGVQALSLAHKELPDVILLDVMMPELDGNEVTRRLRADHKTANIPIILFTARSQIEDKLLGYHAGANIYMTKPTPPKELFTNIRNLIEKSKKDQPISERKKGASGTTIGILAPRGGLGVSTLALNLGICLHKLAQGDVIVADLRPGQGTIGLELGIEKAEGLNHLLECPAETIVREQVEAELVNHSCGVKFLLASSRPWDACFASALNNFKTLVGHLSHLGRYILLDLGVSLNPITAAVATQCDDWILVSEPYQPTATQTRALAEDLISNGVRKDKISLVLFRRSRGEIPVSETKVVELIELPILATLTEASDLASQATARSQPMVLLEPNSLSAHQYDRLAQLVAEGRMNLF